MTGRIVVVALLMTALVLGGVMYWLQVYAFYDRLDPADVTLTVTRDGTVTPLPATDIRAIDADSSPIRFRACFTLAAMPQADPYPKATPLTSPGWFDCFDADQIGADIDSGAATAYLGAFNVEYGIDRVIAAYPDGRAVAWHQINICGREFFEGKPPPGDCPPPPERTE